MNWKTIQCFECDGTGISEGTTPECNQPPSACCGGCYEKYDCNLCEGTGNLYADEEEDMELYDFFLMLDAYEKMTVGYNKTLKDYKEMIKGVSENGLLEMELLLDNDHKVQLGLIRDQLKRIAKHTEILQNEIRKQYE